MTASPHYAHFAVTTLFASACNDAEVCMRLLAVFQRTGPATVSRMALAMAEGDSVQLCRAGHTLKGSALLIGARRLGELAASVERACERSDLGGAALAAAALQHEMTHLMREVADCFSRGVAMLHKQATQGQP